MLVWRFESQIALPRQGPQESIRLVNSPPRKFITYGFFSLPKGNLSDTNPYRITGELLAPRCLRRQREPGFQNRGRFSTRRQLYEARTTEIQLSALPVAVTVIVIPESKLSCFAEPG